MNPRIVVREADGNDLDAVVAVGRQTWPVTHAGLYAPELVDLFLAKWWTKDACIPAIRAGRTLVAEVEDDDRSGDRHVIGMAAYGPHDGAHTIWKLYVLPAWQGHGIGGLLLQAIIHRHGDQALYLSYADGNASAAAFTNSHGFVVDHREKQSDMPDLVRTRRDPDRTEHHR